MKKGRKEEGKEGSNNIGYGKKTSADVVVGGYFIGIIHPRALGNILVMAR